LKLKKNLERDGINERETTKLRGEKKKKSVLHPEKGGKVEINTWEERPRTEEPLGCAKTRHREVRRLLWTV